MTKTFLTNSVSETEKLAEKLGEILKSGDIIAYQGSMGMGKTAFTRGLAKGMKIKDDVSSPTFALINEYNGDGLTLYHFDMYRVSNYDDLYSTGFFDYMDMGGVMAVEWSENIENILPDNSITVTIERIDEDKRQITIKGDERLETLSC
ncbi:MAG: tRNA (adenosine(37)-N6)-threonylcarbamoyltransferase complex ATPase subunit type 1 TsaE [Oscillospiraceae bacterium]